jgi:hypothetical protein
MRAYAFDRYALSISAAAALLSGCGGAQLPVSSPGALPQGRTVTSRAVRGGSWIAPEAKSGDLLYISDVYGVHIFSYPKGLLVGNIYGFSSPAGLCSNQTGDAFVTDTPAGRVYEYAHGSTQRLQTLYDNYVDFNPFDCSVDPTTGNVAVASADSGFVVVFPKAEEKPRVYYEDMADTHMFFCAYDDKGDLFVDQVAKGRHSYVGELPKGTTRFTNYLLDRRVAHPGGIQFDGKHIAIEDLDSLIVYRLRFSGTEAVVMGGTSLSGTGYVQQYWIQGKTLIGPGSNNTVYLWNYPEGGSPVSSIQGLTEPYGSTVSVSARNRPYYSKITDLERPPT